MKLWIVWSILGLSLGSGFCRDREGLRGRKSCDLDKGYWESTGTGCVERGDSEDDVRPGSSDIWISRLKETPLLSKYFHFHPTPFFFINSDSSHDLQPQPSVTFIFLLLFCYNSVETQQSPLEERQVGNGDGYNKYSPFLSFLNRESFYPLPNPFQLQDILLQQSKRNKGSSEQPKSKPETWPLPFYAARGQCGKRMHHTILYIAYFSNTTVLLYFHIVTHQCPSSNLS